MKWKVDKDIKIIHFEGENDLNHPPFNSFLAIGGDIFDSKKGLLPICIQWRYRIHENDLAIFSCIGEAYYLLNFDFNEDPTRDLLDVIEGSFLDFEIKWKLRTKDTQLESLPLPSINEDVRANIVSKIILAAQHFRLLKE